MGIAADEALTYKLIVTSSDKKTISQPQVPAFDGFAVNLPGPVFPLFHFAGRSLKASLSLSIFGSLNTGKFIISERITVKVKPTTGRLK
jgi:hypothetical protein